MINVIINQFDFDFNHLKTIQSKKVDISSKRWIIYDPIITEKNKIIKNISKINLQSNFDEEKINNLFSNFSTLNLLELFNLKEDYEVLGYSSDEVMIHLFKIFSTPFFYALMTVLSAVIMFNIDKKNSLFFYVVLGIVVSVLIYYINFMFISLGNTGKIPSDISVFLPIIFICLITLVGLIRINEK